MTKPNINNPTPNQLISQSANQPTPIILAFSGGLDTSFCIPHLIDQGYKVITVAVNTGGFTPKEVQEIENKSAQLGATSHKTIDGTKDLYKKFATYIIKGNYLKGGVYPACVGPERLIIAEKIAEFAKQQNIQTIAHGSTGCGNDQIRFEVTLKTLLPNCQIIAPIRDQAFTRDQEINFLKEKGFPVPTTSKSYSINKGLLGTTIGGTETLNTHQPLPDQAFPTVKPIKDCPEEKATIKLNFQNGLPTKLNSQELPGPKLIQELDKIATAHGYGKDYHIGTSIVGLKGRIGFEAPAMKILIKAHTELEKTILTSKQIFWKDTLAKVYGDMIHEGLYFDPLTKNIESFLDSANQNCNGEVTLNIEKGNLTIESLNSPHSMFNSNFGVYGEEMKSWSGQDMKSFCKIYGFESTSANLTQRNKQKHSE